MQYRPDYTLKLKSGGEVPLLFITQAIIDYSELTGIDTYEILPQFKFNKMPKVLLAGYRTYCDYNDKPCDADLRTANGWLDDLDMGIHSPQLAELAKLFMWKASGMSKEDFEKAVEVHQEAPKAEKKSSLKKTA